MNWLILLIESIASSAFLFIAHGLPLNTKVIEPEMAKGNKIAFVFGLLYYAFFLAIPIYLSHKILLKI